MILTVAAWIATVAILGTYLVSTRGGPTLPFHWANAIGCIPHALLNAHTRTWPALVITLGFGIPAALAVVRQSRQKSASL